MSNPLLEAALFYREKMNWSIIPLSPGTKIPPKGFEVIPYRERLASREEIISWWTENPNYNIAVITGKLSNLFIVDHDKYKKEYSEEVALQYFSDSIITPTDKSPRGGEHQYFLYPTSDAPTIHADTLPCIDYRGEGGYCLVPPSSFNGSSGQWVIRPDEVPLAAVPDLFLSLIKSNINNKYLIRDVKNDLLKDINDVKNCYFFSKEGHRDEDLYHVGKLLKYGNATPEEMDKVLRVLAKNCNPPFPEEEVYAKIHSILKRCERRERNISHEIRQWSLLIEDEFLLKDCYGELKIVNSHDQLTARVTLNTLCKEKLLEKGKSRGSYRPINKNALEKMRFIEGQIEEFPIILPLELNRMCKLHPKNIIVIAGSKSAGKSAMALNIAVANQNNIPVVYFNSEMGDEEYSERMKNMGFKNESEIKFDMYPLKSNYQDYITEEKKIFIVDYLEVHENFYEIAKPIRKIHENMKDGVCIVAIQMKAGALLGRGGEFSAEKARLYLTMEYIETMRHTKVLIFDAKSPKFSEGIRGMFRHIKIKGGAEISPVDNWRR